MIPVAEYAQANEIGLLQLDLRFGMRSCIRHEFFRRYILAMLLLDKNFDRHAVAIPAGDIDRVVAGQLLRLDDDVLQNLVDRMADVNRRVGVRWAIVQNELWLALRLQAHLFIQLLPLPFRDPHGFAPGEIPAHGKRRIGEIQCALVVNFLIHHQLSAKWFLPSRRRHAFA